MFGGFGEEEVEVKPQVKAESDDPLVCITHLVDGGKCEEEKQMEKCKLCGETLESKRELLSHLRFHKSKKILEENQLDSAAGVVEGVKGDGSGGRQKRKEGESGAILPKRQKRKQVETEAGPILCPNCGSSFNSKTLVTRHQRYFLQQIAKLENVLINSFFQERLHIGESKAKEIPKAGRGDGGGGDDAHPRLRRSQEEEGGHAGGAGEGGGEEGHCF